MYLSELKLWNFRKYGEHKDESAQEISGWPGLYLKFNPYLNILVGENDSGKTAIIDAIKFLLLTQSRDYIKFTREDFHQIEEGHENTRANYFKIQCIFRDLKPEEASHFIEWLGIEKIFNQEDSFFLKVTLIAKRKGDSIYPEIKAGPDEEGILFSGEARDYIRLTYLKPLRDAENEMTPSRNSRLSQILDSHKSFREKEEHPLLEIAKEANKSIELFFKGLNTDGTTAHIDTSGKELVGQINDYLEEFFGEKKTAGFSITDAHLKGILEKLSLKLEYNKAGLGSQNLLFIATELLLLEREEYTGLKLALIEEIEAHLHPQAQLRLIKYLQNLTENVESKFQLILTSHSPNVASEVKLENLVVCHKNKAFPMGPTFTELRKGDYLFLERFLDVTKANLFFAKGIILVEGEAEALIIPEIAEIIDYSLIKYGVSIINVGSKAFMRYANVFKRKDKRFGILEIPVAIITDADVIPLEGKGKHKNNSIAGIGRDLEEERRKAERRYNGQTVKTFVSKYWTLEYDLSCSSLNKDFYLAVLYADYIKNSEINSLTGRKKDKAKEIVNKNFTTWEFKWKADGRIKEKIAFHIYNDVMLKKRQLKSITAQCFAEIIKSQAKSGDAEKARLKHIFETDEHLVYLTNAIKYAAKQL